MDRRASTPMDEVQRLLDQLVAAGAPGAAGWVVDERGGLGAASGLADLETGRPMAPGLRFRAGSMTKSLVATVVLRLVAEGAAVAVGHRGAAAAGGSWRMATGSPSASCSTTPAASPTTGRRSSRRCTGPGRDACGPGLPRSWSPWWPTSRRPSAPARPGRTPTPATSCSAWSWRRSPATRSPRSWTRASSGRWGCATACSRATTPTSRRRGRAATASRWDRRDRCRTALSWTSPSRTPRGPGRRAGWCPRSET